MTDLSLTQIKTLAMLSQLQLTDDEAKLLENDITNILKHIDQLQSLDTSQVAPTYQVTGLSNVWRDDVVQTASPDGQTLVGLAPDATNNQIKVPKVL